MCHVPELVKMPQKVGRVWQLPGGTLALVVGAGLCGPDLGQVWRVELHGLARLRPLPLLFPQHSLRF